MQYDMFYMQRCEQFGGEESVFVTLLSSRLLTTMNVKHAVLNP